MKTTNDYTFKHDDGFYEHHPEPGLFRFLPSGVHRCRAVLHRSIQRLQTCTEEEARRQITVLITTFIKPKPSCRRFCVLEQFLRASRHVFRMKSAGHKATSDECGTKKSQYIPINKCSVSDWLKVKRGECCLDALLPPIRDYA